jgi:hypothetical protein
MGVRRSHMPVGGGSLRCRNQIDSRSILCRISSHPSFQELATFRPLGLKVPVAAVKDGSCAPRNIYIDDGANLANSMDM